MKDVNQYMRVVALALLMIGAMAIAPIVASAGPFGWVWRKSTRTIGGCANGQCSPAASPARKQPVAPATEAPVISPQSKNDKSPVDPPRVKQSTAGYATAPQAEAPIVK